jgi:DNA-binding CsgD family transcriptional regulator
MSPASYLDVGQAADVDTLRSRLVSWTHQAGFGYVAAVVVHEEPEDRAGPLFVSLSNATAEYEASCALSVEDSMRDPVLRRLKRMSVPLIYDQDTYAHEGAGDPWETQAAHGYRTGIAVALHLPAKRHFLLGVDRPERLPDDDDKLARMLADLQLLAVHAQAAAQRILTPPLPCEAIPLIDGRELEILRRTTLNGMSTWEVGRALSISEATVERHLCDFSRKLGTHDKHGAVLRALTLGLIH